MPFNHVGSFLYSFLHQALTNCSFPTLLHTCWRFFLLHDLQSLAAERTLEPAGVYLHLLLSRICVRHVGQSVWNRRQAYRCWRESVHAPVDIRFLVSLGCHDLDPDELSEQGDERVSGVIVSTICLSKQMRLLLRRTG